MRGRLGKEPVTEGIPAGSEGGNRGYAGESETEEGLGDASVVGVHEGEREVDMRLQSFEPS